jgi:dihydroorotate dehydrogenase subfamily 2
MKIIISASYFIYKYLLRPIIFLFDSELVHNLFTQLGEKMGESKIIVNLTKFLFVKKYKSLEQEIDGINFKTPVGLAAGFDYNASLTQILPSIGFGFGTVGTITNKAYEGNPRPRLGRLIKSKSLLVYKGFKNEGIEKITKKLKRLKFTYPVGLSIGKTNSTTDSMTQEEAIKDIISSFKIAEKANLKISYYELNISCPNLFGNVSFYPPKNLKELLENVSKLKLSKPLFIKMPISKTDKEVLGMLNVISKYPVTGIIIGNTQNNRKDKSFVREELKKYPVGNFSGKPTERRSNELIKLAYKKFGKKLIVVGCGGIFNAEDAYKKIKLGASVVQLVTGIVFEGPQLPASINLELERMLKKDGYKNISEAVGTSN